ncbi:hypothetical protein DRO32_02955 [Candidatus Bathyarchaeota archaeon]|nr:MAG: hypothetical protein DRO32_02955 [Candidatus Bathyarchaeota archaeon]
MAERVLAHLGLDDTDSPFGGCTTYVAAILVERLRELGADFVDYPNLVRLNPNAPWKTRGNGAICLRFRLEAELLDEVFHMALAAVEGEADLLYPETHPGLVLLVGEVPLALRLFAKKVIRGLASLDEALRLCAKLGIRAYGFKLGRGIVGALAAVGETLVGDHTYELLAYRTKAHRREGPRQVDPASVAKMDEATRPLTFNNYDWETGRVLITPRGPDPVLLGIRGEGPDVVLRAFRMLAIGEPVERWVIFRTNQGTDAHLVRRLVKDLGPHLPAVVKGRVVEAPRDIPGGHVVFAVSDGTGRVDCAVYEPSGQLRHVARALWPGDLVEVAGGVREGPEGRLTLNVEKMRVLEVAERLIQANPRCPKCGKRMKSMGAGKGFKCPRCGHRDPEARKVLVRAQRAGPKPGLYLPPPRSQRHLTKPLRRYGQEKYGLPGPPKGEWFGLGLPA